MRNGVSVNLAETKLGKERTSSYKRQETRRDGKRLSYNLTQIGMVESYTPARSRTWLVLWKNAVSILPALITRLNLTRLMKILG